jgi:site-specific DNA-cytosine methylase
VAIDKFFNAADKLTGCPPCMDFSTIAGTLEDDVDSFTQGGLSNPSTSLHALIFCAS